MKARTEPLWSGTNSNPLHFHAFRPVGVRAFCRGSIYPRGGTKYVLLTRDQASSNENATICQRCTARVEKYWDWHDAREESTGNDAVTIALGSMPKDAQNPDVLAAKEILAGLEAAALASDTIITGYIHETEAHTAGYMIAPRGNGCVSVYWLKGPDCTAFCAHPDRLEMKRRFIEHGWDTLIFSRWMLAWPPEDPTGSLPTLNVSLLDATLQHIERNPHEWDQTTWQCGTTACFAGHAAILHGTEWAYKLGGYVYAMDGPHLKVPVDEYARKALGLTGNEACRLFLSENTLPALRSIVDQLKTDRSIFQ